MAAAHSPPPPPPPPPPPASSCYRSPQRTPNSSNNNYASTKTPILSAKRPKKWSSSPKPSIGATTTTTTPSSSSSSCSTPTTASIGKIKKTLHATTLSPMHNVRPVPRDSHHVVSNPSACTATAAATAASTNKYGAPETTISTGTSYATTTTPSAAAVDTSTNKSENHSKQYSTLTMIDELEVQHSSSRHHETRNNNNNNNTAGIGGGDEKEEDDCTSAIANNNGPSSASWVGRKVDAIFSPVLSFLSGTTTTAAAAPVTSSSCDKAQQGANDYEDVYDDDYDEGKFIQRSPTTQSTNLEDESESYMHDDVEVDEENNHIYNAVNNDIAATTSSSAALKIARRSSDSTSTTTTVRDVDGDVTMAENYKLHYPLHCDDDDGDDDEVVVAATVYHDEESPPTPTVDKYEHYHGKEQQNVSSRSKNEEQERVNADSNNNDEDVGDVDDDDDEDEFNPYLFIKCLPPYHYAIPPGWFSRPKALPPIDTTSHPPIPPICLVLDLDETLVHCTVEAVSDADMIFPVEFHGVEYQVHVRCRPYLREFLEAVSDKFEVVIFTASQQVYADKLLDKIDPEGRFIRHRMFRDSCLPVEGNFLKDLSILGRDLSKAVLVDNSPHAFGYQVDNGIPIESWFDDPTDKELLKLEMFLRTLHGVDDVREVVRKTFQTHRLVMDA